MVWVQLSSFKVSGRWRYARLIQQWVEKDTENLWGPTCAQLSLLGAPLHGEQAYSTKPNCQPWSTGHVSEPDPLLSRGGVTLLYPDLRFPRLPTSPTFSTTPKNKNHPSWQNNALGSPVARLPALSSSSHEKPHLCSTFLQRVFTASKMSPPVSLSYFVWHANPGAFSSSWERPTNMPRSFPRALPKTVWVKIGLFLLGCSPHKQHFFPEWGIIPLCCQAGFWSGALDSHLNYDGTFLPPWYTITYRTLFTSPFWFSSSRSRVSSAKYKVKTSMVILESWLKQRNSHTHTPFPKWGKLLRKALSLVLDSYLEETTPSRGNIMGGQLHTTP